MLVMNDDTFDGLLVLQVLHKIVVVSYYYSAFDIDPLELLLQLNKPVMLNDVKRIRANHRNVLEKRLRLYRNGEEISKIIDDK